MIPRRRFSARSSPKSWAGIEKIDFIWADMQGVEGHMIPGGKKYYRIDLRTLIGMLPGSWRIVELWFDDVLLET
jgi:hypothetical protein